MFVFCSFVEHFIEDVFVTLFFDGMLVAISDLVMTSANVDFVVYNWKCLSIDSLSRFGLTS